MYVVSCRWFKIYKQADIALQENKPEQAIQYCQEVLKTIPDHQGCLAIQKQFKKNGDK